MTHVAATTPYAWPFDGQLSGTRTALIVAGADAVSAGRVPSDPAAEGSLMELRVALPAVGVLVVLVHHDVAGTGGGHAAPPPPTDPASPPVALDGELVVTAAGHDGFYGSALDALLRRHGRTHLLVAGLGFETTVHSTLRRANDRGYECLVVADACVSGDAGLRHASVSSIEMSGGIFGAVGLTSHVLAAYCGTSAQEQS